MAKKVVATLKKQDTRGYSKVIRTVRSPKTGAYTFKEEIMPTDMVPDFLNSK
jgi:hypothetical protein